MQDTMIPMNPKFRFFLSMLIFGSIGLFVRGIALSSGVIAFARGVMGVLVLLLATLLQKKHIRLAALKRNWLLLLLCGAAIGANWICLFEAYATTTIAVATLSYYLAPVFVVLLSPLVQKEKLTLSKTVCVFVSLLGMAFVADVFSAKGSIALGGIGFGVAAAMLYASVMLMNKFLCDITDMESTIAQLAVAAFVLLPYVLLTEKIPASPPDLRSMLLLLVVGIVHTGFAYLIYFGAMRQLPSQTVAVLSYIDPVTALLLSALLLHESMNALQIVGAVLILSATFASEIRSTKHAAISSPPRPQ